HRRYSDHCPRGLSLHSVAVGTAMPHTSGVMNLSGRTILEMSISGADTQLTTDWPSCATGGSYGAESDSAASGCAGGAFDASTVSSTGAVADSVSIPSLDFKGFAPTIQWVPCLITGHFTSPFGPFHWIS